MWFVALMCVASGAAGFLAFLLFDWWRDQRAEYEWRKQMEADEHRAAAGLSHGDDPF